MTFVSVGWADLARCNTCDHIIDNRNQDWSHKPMWYWRSNQPETSLITCSLLPLTPCRFDFLLWCLCGACHTPTPQQRRLLLASSSVSSVSKSSRAATLPVPALTPARSLAPLTWWRWPSRRPSRLTCHRATAPTAASTAGHTWPTTTSSSQRYARTDHSAAVLSALRETVTAIVTVTVTVNLDLSRLTQTCPTDSDGKWSVGIAMLKVDTLTIDPLWRHLNVTCC